MRLLSSICLVLFAAGLGFVVCDDEIKTEEGVLILTKDNFDTAISTHEFIMVEFYAPWCGHCKSLAPKYAKAAQTLAAKNSNIKLGKVDATEEQELAEKHGVRGYPTMKFFRNGSPIEYSGRHEEDVIISWLEKKTGSPAKELETVESAEEFMKENKVAVVGFFKDRDSKEAKSFMTTANALDDYPFAVTSSEEVYAKYEAKCGSVILFKHFDEEKAVFEGELTEEALKAFVTNQAIPLVVEYNHETALKIFGGEMKNYLLFLLSKQDGDMEKYAEPAKAIAKDYRKDVRFVTINADEEDHQRILHFCGVKKEEVPAMRIVHLEEEGETTKYKPATKDLSVEKVKDFVQKFLDGNMKQYFLTQDLPEDWDKTPVKTLVSTNFDEVAFDKSKDVFIEFYAPWCGHCKQLAPIYDQLGEKFKDSETIVIAKMDAHVNELEHTKITSFPTLKLYKKGDNSIIDYNGERTLEGFTKFLESGGAEAEVEPEVTEEINIEEKEIKDEL